jgi:hypothetical protein
MDGLRLIGHFYNIAVAQPQRRERSRAGTIKGLLPILIGRWVAPGNFDVRQVGGTAQQTGTLKRRTQTKLWR